MPRADSARSWECRDGAGCRGDTDYDAFVEVGAFTFVIITCGIFGSGSFSSVLTTCGVTSSGSFRFVTITFDISDKQLSTCQRGSIFSRRVSTPGRHLWIFGEEIC